MECGAWSTWRASLVCLGVHLELWICTSEGLEVLKVCWWRLEHLESILEHFDVFKHHLSL